MALFQMGTPDIAVDIGTNNTRVYVKDKGIVVNEPSVVIVRNDNSKHIIAVGDSAEEMVMELSERKARAVAERYKSELVLAADTLVFGDEVLGKPKSPEHAIDMLGKLSGNWHSVFTGLTLIDTVTGTCIRRADQTRVHFVTMSAEDIAAYVATKEPLDKAGAYGIQGQGGMFIDRIEGSYSNVVGLPMALLRSMLIEMNDLI